MEVLSKIQQEINDQHDVIKKQMQEINFQMGKNEAHMGNHRHLLTKLDGQIMS